MSPSRVLAVVFFSWVFCIPTRGAVPRIYGVSANSGRIGEVITVFGDDFIPDRALVLVGGAPAAVIMGSVGFLDVRVPGGAVAGPISVTEDGMTATSSSYFDPLPLSSGTLTNLYAQRSITTNGGFLPVGAVADLDGDGKSDIVTARPTSLEIFLNRAREGLLNSNSFVGVSLPLKRAPTDIAARDLDGDGRPDLIFIEGEMVKVRQNLIGGSEISSNSFGASLSLTRNNSFPPVRVADMDHDGRPDIVARNAKGIQVFLNRSTNEILTERDFTNVFTLASSSGLKTQTAQTFEVADLNEDGHADVAAVIGTNLVIFAIEDETGMLRTNFIRSFVLGPSRGSFSIADLNNDGNPDLVTSELGQVVGYINHSAPDNFDAESFEKVVLILSGYPSIRTADFDGDGRTELLAEGRYILKIVVENGKIVPQGFQNEIAIRLEPYIFAIGDFNGDNRPDIVGLSNFAPSPVVILQNLSEGAPTRLGISVGTSLRSSRATLGIIGAPMTVQHLETSEDLIHWQPGTDVRLTIGGEGSYADSMTATRIFFRARQ